tara:strand:- start:4394 stop:5788 length:1395 start_codon:yes stop_codon:yes gene_type:complete
MIKLIAAVSNNRGIGKDNQIPWRLQKEMNHFREVTTLAAKNKYNIVIMGRKTWESIPECFRPLKKRKNYIISSKLLYQDYVFKSLRIALLHAKRDPHCDTIFIIGGEQLYKEAILSCDEIILSVIRKKYDCDRFFPLIPTDFSINSYISCEDIDTKTNKKVKYNIINYSKSKNKYDHPEFQYISAIRDILSYGYESDDRTGVGTLSKIGVTMRFDISKYFPLLTTKKTFMKAIIHELLWFLRGETNATLLKDKGVRIWDGNTSREFLDNLGFTDREVGDGGPIYGFNFRHYGAEYINCQTDYKGFGVDQVKYVIDLIKNNPTSRRILINLWNPTVLNEMVLPPCHMVYQFFVKNNKLSCSMYQRSGDMGLGVPFNIASATLMTHIFAKICKLEVGEFVHTIGDAHIYKNHIIQLEEQIKRNPTPFPILEINKEKEYNKVEDFEYKDFKLIGYLPQDPIKMKMAI